MRRGLRFPRLGGQIKRHAGKSRQDSFGLSVRHRRLLCEALEDRRLLSATTEACNLLSSSSALFVENAGQIDASVDYAFYGMGSNIFLTDSGAIFQVSKNDSGTSSDNAATVNSDTLAQTEQFSISFVGADLVSPVGLNQSETVYNYYVGDATQWRSNLSTYEEVAYHGLYNGVDLIIAGQSDSLKYEFHVAAGADYEQIQVNYSGIEGLSVDGNGSLHIQTALGELVDEAPYIYQVINGETVQVEGKFVLLSDNTYAFDITGNYDANYELVIDPALGWSTFIGGGDYDQASAVAVNASGSVLVTGWTNSADLVYANNASSGNYDAFVAQISSTGAVQWVTYLGGSSVDQATGIATDSANNVVVSGSTFSSDLAGANNTIQGDYDAFVAKFSTYGALQWSTYVGGVGTDIANGIAVDSADAIVVVGYTSSATSFVGAGNAYQGGSYDAFVGKIGSTGTLAWATFTGGMGLDWGTGIAVDSSDNVYITGHTSSDDFTGAINSYASGSYDAFVARISSAGTQLWATFLGGLGSDYGTGIAVNSSDTAYIIGTTSSDDLPAPTNTYVGGAYDAFVARISAAGAVLWATYLGGMGADYGSAIAIDPSDAALITGHTCSDDFVGMGNTYQSGPYDAFVAKMSSAGSLQWANYLGGAGDDKGSGIAVSSSDTVFVVGVTSSNDFPSMTNSYRSGAYDGFVTRFTPMGVIDVDAPTVALAAPATTNDKTPTVTVAATDMDSGVPDGTTVYVDVDLNNDGDFTDPGETAYATGTLAGGIAAITLPSLPEGTYRLRARVSDACGNEGTSNVATMVVDVTNPTVTINQAAGQADPTTISPVNFTVVFSEAVTDFTSTAITLTGTTSGTLVATVTGIGTTYNVAVTGMTNSGMVVAGIAANKVHDAAGNANAASTSADNIVWFTVANHGPTISNVAVNATTSANKTTITWNVADPNRVGSVKLTIDGKSASIKKSGSKTAVKCSYSGKLKPGTYAYTIRATDSKGAMSAYIGTFTVQATVPTIYNVKVKATTAAKATSISWKVTDIDGVAFVGLTIDGTSMPVKRSGCSHSPTYSYSGILSAGMHTFTITAIDSYGVTGTYTGTLKVNSPMIKASVMSKGTAKTDWLIGYNNAAASSAMTTDSVDSVFATY